MKRRGFLMMLVAVGAGPLLPRTVTTRAGAPRASLDMAKINGILPKLIEHGRTLQSAQSAFFAQVQKTKTGG